jgi:hypothetical protein
LPDVYRVKEEILHPKFDGKIRPDLDANGDGDVTPEDGTMTLVKRMTIAEKTAHWQQVFQHAEDRGIEIYLKVGDASGEKSDLESGLPPLKQINRGQVPWSCCVLWAFYSQFNLNPVISTRSDVVRV